MMSTLWVGVCFDGAHRAVGDLERFDVGEDSQHHDTVSRTQDYRSEAARRGVAWQSAPLFARLKRLEVAHTISRWELTNTRRDEKRR